MDSVQLAAVLATVVLIASVISIEVGVTVALLELTLGVVAGNLFHLQTQEWLDFIAKFGSIVLTFLAGMEVDPAYMRRRLGASFGIGATFVTDLCTALALSAIFIKPNIWFPVFLAVSLLLIVVLPRIAPWFFGRYGDRVIEPEIKLVFLCLLVLMVLADESNGHAVLPAFVLGLVMSRHYQEHREEQKRLRVVAFAFLTPFFFIKGGMNVSLGAVVTNLGLLAVLLVAKMLPKIAFVYPLARRSDRRSAKPPRRRPRPDRQFGQRRAGRDRAEPLYRGPRRAVRSRARRGILRS